MTLKFNNVDVTEVRFNGSAVSELRLNGASVWSDGDPDYLIENGRLVDVNPTLYLRSDGNQYIDTGLVATSLYTYKVSCRPSFSSIPSQSDNIVFGQRTSGAHNTSYEQIYLDFSNWDRARLSMTWGQSANPEYTFSGITRYNFTLVDQRSSSSAATTERSLYLYSYNATGSASGFFSGDIYNFSVYSGVNTILKMVPVKKGLKIGSFTVPSNGMFDIVSQTFFGNLGTGEFEIGSDESALPWGWMDCTVVGSPTINGSLISNFSATNYIQTVDAIDGAEDFEVGVSLYGTQPMGGGYPDTFLLIPGGAIVGSFSYNHYDEYWLSDSDGSRIAQGTQGTYYHTINTWYLYSISQVGNIITGKFDMNIDKTFTATTHLNGNRQIILGSGAEPDRIPDQYLRGYIDLSGCYIIRNGTRYKLRIVQ